MSFVGLQSVSHTGFVSGQIISGVLCTTGNVVIVIVVTQCTLKDVV